MGLLNFFIQQRKLWQSQAGGTSAEYLAGGLAGLDQAEAAFKVIPLYNAYQQLADTQRELEEVSYQLSVARKQIKSLTANTIPEQVKATLSLSLLKYHRSRAHSARKVLRKVVEAINHPQMRPETKLRKIAEMAERFLAAHGEKDNEI